MSVEEKQLNKRNVIEYVQVWTGIHSRNTGSGSMYVENSGLEETERWEYVRN